MIDCSSNNMNQARDPQSIKRIQEKTTVLRPTLLLGSIQQNNHQDEYISFLFIIFLGFLLDLLLSISSGTALDCPQKLFPRKAE